jgi:hypothetical protein
MQSADPSPNSLPGAAWSSATPPRRERSDSALARFLGGSPGAVLIRLVVLSFLVGALLMWLDIQPQDVVRAVERFFRRIWNLGFDSIREAADYILAGALIVVPIWLVIRLLNMRGPR